MSHPVATLDLRSLDLAPGAATALRLRVPPVALRLGGQDYRVAPERPEVELRVTRSLSGRHLRLRAQVELIGPCWRCVEEARIPLEVSSEEFQADDRPAGAARDDDLDSAYIDRDELDVALWVRDAVAEAVPPAILCREDCAGLCPTCGADLNAGDCGCAAEATDPRWSALAELSERLGRPDEG